MNRCVVLRLAVMACASLFAVSGRGQGITQTQMPLNDLAAQRWPGYGMPPSPWNSSVGVDVFNDFPPPRIAAPPPTAETISVDQLRHPLSSKAARLIDRALKLSKQGNHAAAVAKLEETLAKQPSSAPYVHSLLGIEYMKMGNLSDAAVELDQAVRLFPHESVNHSNFALTLYALRRYDLAETEVRTALALDGSSKPAKEILESILHDRKALAQPAANSAPAGSGAAAAQ